MQVAEGNLKGQTNSISTWLLKWWPYLLATLIGIVTKLPSLNNNIIFIDEPNYLAQAKRLDSLEAFIYAFQYRTEVKFQWSILPQIIALAISHDNAILIMRVFGLIAVIISFCLLITISKQLFKTLLPGFFAMVSWAMLLNYDSFTAPPLLEYFQSPLLLICFWQFVKAIENEKKAGWHLFWSGISLSFAVMIKISCLTTVPIFGLVLIFYQNKLNVPRFSWAKVKQTLWMALGFLLPLVITIGPYFFNSAAMAELKISMIEINFNAYGKLSNTTTDIKILLLLFFFGALNLTLLGVTTIPFIVSSVFFHRNKWSRLDTYQLLLILIGWSLFAGFVPGLVKPIYLIPVLPFLMLFVGYRLNHYLSMLNTSRLRTIAIVIFSIGFLIAYSGNLNYYYKQLFVDKGQFYYEDMNGLDVPALVNYVKANTKPGDLIWEYYNFPEIFWLTNRKPATAEPTAAFLYLLLDDFWFKRTAEQLNTELPTLIIGVNTPHRPTEGTPILTDLPRIKDFLTQRYNCNTTIINNAILCKLNTP